MAYQQASTETFEEPPVASTSQGENQAEGGEANDEEDLTTS